MIEDIFSIPSINVLSEDNKVLRSDFAPKFTLESLSNNTKRIALNISDLAKNNKDSKFSVALNIDNIQPKKGTFVSLGHIYDFTKIDSSIFNDSNEQDILTEDSYEFSSNNYPNPFNPFTLIRFTIPYETKVKIEIFNIRGQRVNTLVNKYMDTGIHSVEFNGQNLSSGVYFYRIEAGEFQDVKKMILLK